MTSPDLNSELPANGAPDDLALLRRVADGDRDAFRRLYSQYHRRLHRFLMRLTRDRQLAEEVINDTMLVVWQHARDFRGASRVSTWILGIGYRRALKSLERRRNCERAGCDRRHLPPRRAARCSMRSRMARKRTTGWTSRSLTFRPSIAWCSSSPISSASRARRSRKWSECPLGTVKTRMFYGRERLRQVLVTLAVPEKNAAAAQIAKSAAALTSPGMDDRV